MQTPRRHSILHSPAKNQKEWEKAGQGFEGARTRAPERETTQSNRDAGCRTGTRAERASQFSRSKWVRAKVRISPQIETSSGERAKLPRACGARLWANANSCLRMRAKSEGGHGMQK